MTSGGNHWSLDHGEGEVGERMSRLQDLIDCGVDGICDALDRIEAAEGKFRKEHPNLPLYLSIAALIAAIAKPLICTILTRTT